MACLHRCLLIVAFTSLLLPKCLRAEERPAVEFLPSPGRVAIVIGGNPFATYVYRDDKILRPYFTKVMTSDGAQVTRRHPPREGMDSTDHPTMHPGVWLAFGDLAGADFWRNRERVEHVEFVKPPQGGPGSGTFVVRNRYLDGKRVVCTELCRHTVAVTPDGYLLTYESEFQPAEGPLIFGDQEEMGLGVRVATELTVRDGQGRIVNSAGGENEKQVWGRQADWCRYGGTIDGTRRGIVLMPGPRNFRKSWFHARDYGLLVANPFGRKVFTGGKASRVPVEPGQTFRLTFGVLVYSQPADKPFDAAASYRDFVERLRGVDSLGRDAGK